MVYSVTNIVTESEEIISPNIGLAGLARLLDIIIFIMVPKSITDRNFNHLLRVKKYEHETGILKRRSLGSIAELLDLFNSAIHLALRQE